MGCVLNILWILCALVLGVVICEYQFGDIHKSVSFLIVAAVLMELHMSLVSLALARQSHPAAWISRRMD